MVGSGYNNGDDNTLMKFGYNDGTQIEVKDCDTDFICQDGGSCFQLIVFNRDTKDQNSFILDETKKTRDKLFAFVREEYG